MDIYITAYCSNYRYGDGRKIIVVVDNNEILYEWWDETKNEVIGRLELTIFKEALNFAKNYPEKFIRIHTESQYCEQGYNNWSKKWRRNKWKGSDRKQIQNRDLWEKLDKLRFSNTDILRIKKNDKSKWVKYLDEIKNEYKF